MFRQLGVTFGEGESRSFIAAYAPGRAFTSRGVIEVRAFGTRAPAVTACRSYLARARA